MRDWVSRTECEIPSGASEVKLGADECPVLVHAKELEYANPYQRVYRVDVDIGTQSKQIYVNRHGRRAGVVIVRDGEVLLVRQYRLLLDGLSLELPGGGVDEGERPDEAAVREVEEEAWIRCHELKPLVFFHPGLDTCDNPTFLYWCESFEVATGGGPEGGEVVDQVWLPVTECVEMIYRGGIVDSLTICGLLAYYGKQAQSGG